MARAQTGIAFEKISGKLADGVAYGHRGGTALRSRPEYRYPLQPSQRENNDRLRKANALFNSLEGWEADLWTLHGERHPHRDPMSGALYAPPAKNLLVGLSCKLLQIDPDASLPRLPPEGTFAADLVDVRVEAIGEDSLPLGRRVRRQDEREDEKLEVDWRSSSGGKGGVDSLLDAGRSGVSGRIDSSEELGSTPSLPSPRGEDTSESSRHRRMSETAPQSEPTGLLFSAPRPSRPDALTELMVQPLKNPRCKPGTFYKSRGFATFPEGQPTVFLPLPPGAYAVAIQTVDPTSGRTAGFTLLGKVTVE